MTGTSVKDVGSILGNLTPPVGNRTTGVGQAGFQAVLNDQTQKNAENQTTEDTSAARRPAQEEKPGDSLKPKNTDRVQQPKRPENAPAEGENEEPGMSPEDMEKAMEVLGTAAADLVRQTAELLEIPVEEVQGIMEDLGMTELDILDPAKLSALFLQAAGVEDSYALVTDEGLYEDFRTLMGRLETALQECGRQIEAEPAQVQTVLAQLQEKPVEGAGMPPEDVSPEKGTVESGLPEAGNIVVQGAAEANVHREAAADTGRREQKEGGSEPREQQGGNLFIQNLRTEEFRPEIQRPEETMGAAGTDTEDIMRQIMDYMKIQLKEDTSRLEMQLHPASLGTVQVQIASRGGEVTANFITQNEAVKAALESQMAQLIERFDEQGVKVEAIEVTVQAHEFERNLEQGQGRGQQGNEPAKKGRTRRINLNEALSMENMAEEDALAADIMAVNGNTVDYTA